MVQIDDNLWEKLIDTFGYVVPDSHFPIGWKKLREKYGGHLTDEYDYVVFDTREQELHFILRFM